MIEQKCSKCGGLMEKWKRGKHPVCQKCQRLNANLRTRIRDNLTRKILLNDPKNHQWSNWVCDCEDANIYERGPENNMCWMGCCKMQPKS